MKLQWAKEWTGGRTNNFDDARFCPKRIRAFAVTMSDVSPSYGKTEHFRISDTNWKGRQYFSVVWRLAETLTTLPGEIEVCAESYCDRICF